MATGTKTGALSYLAETPQEQAALTELQASRKALQDALMNRQQLFDPTLLAMAQGFLAPTKTGGFGESLANVAGMVAPVQAAEQKRELEMAQIRSELAAQQLGMAQQMRGEQEFRDVMKSAFGAGAGATGAAPGAAGAPAEGAGGMRPLTEADVLRLSVAPGQKENAKTLMDLMKTQRDRFAISQNGIVFDKAASKYLDLEIPGQKQEEFSTPYGTFRMTPNEYAQFSRAERQGKGEEWIQNFRKPGGMAEKPAGGGRPTVGEEEATRAGERKRAELTATSEVERTQEAIGRGENYTGQMASYRALDQVVSRPDANKVFGILARPGVAEAVLSLIQDTVRSGPSSTISVPGLENALRNVGVPQELINQYQFGLSIIANIQLQQAKLAAGQGAVSNFERNLFAAASISPQDNPATIRAKLDMLKARAELDRDVARELRRSKMSLDEFKDRRADWYDSRVDAYLNRVTQISERLGLPPVKNAPSGGAPASEASRRLREELGI